MKLPWPVRLPWRRAAIERAAWLSDDTLLTIGWCLAPPDTVTASLAAGGSSRPLQARWVSYPRPDVDAAGGAGRVAIIRFPSPRDRHRSGTLTLGPAGASWSLTTHALQRFTA